MTKIKKIDKTDREDVPLTTFNSQLSAKNHLFTLTEAFNLCQKLCGLFDTHGSCFQYKITYTCTLSFLQSSSIARICVISSI